MAEVSPIELLNHILEVSDTKPADLVGLIGSSSVVSEIVNDTRVIGKAEAKILSDRFKVSPSLCIE